jgi:hypothetical protein
MRFTEKLNVELSPDHERFLMFLCLVGGGLVGYLLTQCVHALH